MDLAIQTVELTKRFPGSSRLGGFVLPLPGREGTLAVDHVSLAVGRGEIFGLVGPNGAGKTTLVKMLSTLILPTSGRARVNGYDLADEERIKASIGLVTLNERSFYWRLSCRENLRFYAGLHDLSSSRTERRIAELVRLLDMGDFIDKRYDACSTGMRHRLALARSLLHDPALLFLDEPTRSLDPLAAARFREMLYALAHQQGRTVFLVTHDLDEAVELCSRVGVMVRGQVQVVDDPRNLRRLIRPQERCLLTLHGFTPWMRERLLEVEGVLGVTEHEAVAGTSRVELCLRDRKVALPEALRAIRESGGTVDELHFETASWDDVFQGIAAEAATTNGAVRSGGFSRRAAEAATPGGEVGSDGFSRPAAEAATPGGEVGSDGFSRPAAEADTPSGEVRSDGFSRPAAEAATANGEVRSGGFSRRAAEAATTSGEVGSDGFSRLLRALYKLLLFLRRDFREQTSYRLSFILQFLGIFFSVASFYFVGRLFGVRAEPYLSSYGGNYFSFVLIGIAFVGYQGVALYTFSGVIQSAQSAGTLEAMLVTPTRLPTILAASSLWNFAFTSFRIVVYLLMGVIVFGADLRHANVLAALVIMGLTITALSGIGMLSAAFIMAFKRGDPVNFLIGSLSSLLGGVYYPVEVLPAWLQMLARLFPLTYSLAAMRRALLAGESLAALWPEAAALAAFSALLLPLGLIAFRDAVRQARKDGSLAQF